jgi:hypothetical protein
MPSDLGDDFTRFEFREHLAEHLRNLPRPPPQTGRPWPGAQLRPVKQAPIALGDPVILSVSC